MEKSSTDVSQWPMIATYSRMLLTPVIMWVLTSELPHSEWIAVGLFSGLLDRLAGWFFSPPSKVRVQYGAFYGPYCR